ncbi:M24 family metallopeptidase [Carboxydothermus hydrogenoformans]|uniref:Putative proline dipeptidase n=1 Tax=Carboxydothermus hydrogenoformans (strain ATCC BAA-161 / DSM 6008 / Z-2901) TaxID=246194 RepID=Q3ACM8_CARHZ|nr:Xaa-Pro peptidase family protein [Carboxydothermus hydrogenoformans]ABB13671.1 putative proline dipeptidase [Carboxydothermus hydrogenoformans Z-2901]
MKDKLIHRIKKIQNLMAKKDIDILVVVNRENLIYFTGLTQIECMAVLIPLKDDPCAITLWLDADYVEQESGLKTFGYFFPKESLGSKVVERIKAYGFRAPRIGFERYFVPFAFYDVLRQNFPESNFVDAADLFYRVRAVKEPNEVEMIRRAAFAVCKGMEAAIKTIKPGISELDVLAEAEYAMLKAGSNGLPFRPQIVSGNRCLLTHPHASTKLIEEGEVVVVHLGATYNGYCAKMCRTVAVGEISAAHEKVFNLLLEAQEKAIAALRPGSKAWEVDEAAREVIRRAGFEEYYLDVIGYGVGLRQSEFYPIIGKGRQDIIEVGMVVDLLLPTIYHRDVGGPRITDVIYVGENENEILTGYPRKLIKV